MKAKDILLRAVQCDRAGRFLEAQSLYQEGIEILMPLIEKQEDLERRQDFYKRVKEYIDRVELITNRVQKQISRGELIASIPIRDDSDGFTYQKLFGKYLSKDVEEVLLEEPYLRKKHQFYNFIIFLELVVKNCPEIKFVRLITKPDPEEQSEQTNMLGQVRADLRRRNIVLSVKFEDTLHDRKIFLNNGYVIKIGRGLDFFKPTSPQFSLGLNDYEFRKCLRTDVDIWRTKKLMSEGQDR